MPTDTQILNEQLNALRANDEEVLRQLYHQNYRRVESYVLQNNGSKDEAVDVFQDAFIAVWRNIQLNKFKLRDGSSIDAYLIQIARYKWLDQLRQKSVKKRVSLPAVLPDISFEALEDEELQQLDKIKEKFLQLGDKCKDLLAKFYYGKQSMREIAKAFNWTEATAKNNKYRCIEKLKTLVKQDYE